MRAHTYSDTHFSHKLLQVDVHEFIKQPNYFVGDLFIELLLTFNFLIRISTLRVI